MYTKFKEFLTAILIKFNLLPPKPELTSKKYILDPDYMDKMFEFREYYLYEKLQHDGCIPEKYSCFEVCNILRLDFIQIEHKKLKVECYYSDSEGNKKFRLINKNNKVSYWDIEDLSRFIVSFYKDWKIYDNNGKILFPKD